MTAAAAVPPHRTLVTIEDAIRSAWSADTCDPVDLADWSTANPSRGQCGVTALVVRELLGGEVLLAEVRHADGSRQGVHYWNRLAGGLELDLTREQFLAGEVILEAEPVEVPEDTSGSRLARQHALLRSRVLTELGLEPAGAQTRR